MVGMMSEKNEDEIDAVKNAKDEKKTTERDEKKNGRKHKFIYIYICIICKLLLI